MAGLPAINHANRRILTPEDSDRLRELLIQHGEPPVARLIGCCRGVLLRAAARLPIYDRDEHQIRTALEGLKAVER